MTSVHSRSLACPAQVIFGMNGYVWVMHSSVGSVAESGAVKLNDVAEALRGTAEGGAALLSVPRC